MGRRNKVKLKRNDLFIGIYILSAVLFFIISIPSWLLDILLAFNIMVALVILFNSSYINLITILFYHYYHINPNNYSKYSRNILIFYFI